MNSTIFDTQPAPSLLWTVDLTEPPVRPPLVVDDLLLVPTREPGPAAHRATLRALSPADGSPCWQEAFEYALITGLATVHPSTPAHPDVSPLLLSLTSTDLLHGEGALVALDAAGEERWRWAPGVQRVSAPALVRDLVRSDDFSRSEKEATEVATPNLSDEGVDAVCVTADARTLVILDFATGEERARVPLEGSASLSTPAVVGDVAYVPCRGPHLLAVGLDGEARWRFNVQGGSDAWLDRTPVVVGDRVYAVLTTGAVLALRAGDGALAWRAEVGPAGKPLSAPATDGKRLFVGARDGLHALELADGRLAWDLPTQRRITAAPQVVGDLVYAADHDHCLYALDAATGRKRWRYEVERRVEVSPVPAVCGKPPVPCVLVADRGGALTAVACPLSAEEYEVAGHWIEAATAYAAQGRLARGAELLADHGEHARAAALWEAAGEEERAAAQYGAAGAWGRAAELWAALGRPVKRAQVLEQHARSQEAVACTAEERAAAWRVAAEAFEAVGRVKRAVACRREVARWLRQPIIKLEVEVGEGLLLEAWSRLQFVVCNDGYGPARSLVIRAHGDEFEGQVMRTQRIFTLPAGQERSQWLDVRPLAHGDSVPLQVSVEYEDRSGEFCTCEQTIYIPVARIGADRDAGQVFHITTGGGAFIAGGLDVEGDYVAGDKRTGIDQRGQQVHGPQTNIAGDARGAVLSGQFQGPVAVGDSAGAAEPRDRDADSLRRQLAEARENLRLIQERRSQYVMEVEIPLDLVKQERRLERRVAELEARLARLADR